MTKTEAMRRYADPAGVGVLDIVSRRHRNVVEVGYRQCFFVGETVQFFRKFRTKLGEAKIIGIPEKGNELHFDSLPKEVRRGDLILIEGI